MRYLGIVTCHIESDTCLLATPWQHQRKLSSGVLRRMRAVLRKWLWHVSCSLHKLCFEWSITKIDRVVFMFWRFLPWHMGKSSRSVRTRSRIVAKPYQFLYERPFPDDWKSPDTSRKADAVSANLFEVLIAIKQTPVMFICRASLSLSLSLSHSPTHSLFLFLTKKKNLPPKRLPALVGHVWSLLSVSLVTRPCCCHCCNY